MLTANRLTKDDLYLFNEGTHRTLGEKLGAHISPEGGTTFAVWAPNAQAVSVVGDFNAWNKIQHPLSPLWSSGIWEAHVPEASAGDIYKFAITTASGTVLEKADPFALCTEVPPLTGSVIWDLDYTWQDDEWMATRGARMQLDAPISVYEMHAGSWRRDPENPGRFLSYAELATPLIQHLLETGFTHVEFLPLMEHPFYGSWGYQTTGFFAPTRRYGTPQQLMELVDRLHQAGIGVIFDWVPSHFPTDAFALGNFDGTHLFEHADPRLGFHPDWKSFIFNYSRHEVRSFLASSADHWLRRYHVDGIRVDAVASMLYLDYSRQAGEWIPNRFGGRENLDAIEFLHQLNSGIYADHPDVQTIAEESTAFSGVSRPVHAGGLGFGLKWDMGWMHDTLEFMSRDPIHRSHHHGELTFRAIYAFSENFMLPLSHDEVVYGKGSLLGKMPGDTWQRFANLRLLYGYQWAVPGKKLLFMGGELAPWSEWSHEGGLDWSLRNDPDRQGVAHWLRDLNRLYRAEPALHDRDTVPEGFAWTQPESHDDGLLSFLRFSDEGDAVLVVCNYTPVPRYDVQAAVSTGGTWHELLNSDAEEYGGSGVGNMGTATAIAEPWGDQPYSMRITAPPLSCVFFGCR